MEPQPVKLIVKAPNQKIEDQTVQCELSWSVGQLKKHLSRVYPCKPGLGEQRLIYSGQLLTDTQILKDVLRHYDGQESHIMHLVCKSYNDIPSQSTAAPEPKVNEPVPPALANSATVQPHPQNTPMYPWNVPFAPIDPNQVALQAVWLNQMYMHYMNQYMQLQQVQQAIPTDTTLGAPVVQEVQGVQARDAPADLDPVQENDWLEILYWISRLIVFSSFVYFYSNPIRFAVVLIVGVLVYLHQVRALRNHNNPIGNNNNNNINNNNVENNAEERQPAVGAEDPNVNNMGGQARPSASPQLQTPSKLTIAWTFVTSFITSIIPEIPNAI